MVITYCPPCGSGLAFDAKSPPELADSIAGGQLMIHFDGEECTARAYDEKGRELPTLIAYWFAWYAFHPDSEVFRAE